MSTFLSKFPTIPAAIVGPRYNVYSRVTSPVCVNYRGELGLLEYRFYLGTSNYDFISSKLGYSCPSVNAVFCTKVPSVTVSSRLLPNDDDLKVSSVPVLGCVSFSVDFRYSKAAN